MKRVAKKTSPARRRALRVRKNLRDAPRPRLSVFRSSKFIYAQVIDDVDHRTLAAADSLGPVRMGQLASGGNLDAAKLVGRAIADRAKEAGVERVVFDRGPYKYHGRIRALAEAAREAGLKF